MLEQNGDLTPEELNELAQNDSYMQLASSIAPTFVIILLLLLLVSNIYICVMGNRDSGLVKSQLFGYINRFAVRSQYTRGRSSAGVSLSAAVTKDPLTNEVMGKQTIFILTVDSMIALNNSISILAAANTQNNQLPAALLWLM